MMSFDCQVPEAVRLLAGAFAEKGGLPRRKLKAAISFRKQCPKVLVDFLAPIGCYACGARITSVSHFPGKALTIMNELLANICTHRLQH